MRTLITVLILTALWLFIACSALIMFGANTECPEFWQYGENAK